MHRLATVHVRDNQRPTNQRRHDTAYLNKRLFYQRKVRCLKTTIITSVFMCTKIAIEHHLPCYVCSHIHWSRFLLWSYVRKVVSMICYVDRRISMAFLKHSSLNSSPTSVSVVNLCISQFSV